MPELCKYGYEAAAASHKGRVRSSNEDAFGICAEDGLFVVCDGMGGAAAGEIASRVAVETMVKSLCGTSDPETEVASGSEGETNAGAPTLLREAIASANQLVFAQAANDSRLHGMGTTLVALLVGEKQVWVAHVGDSRCYRYRGGQMEQLTRDHSLVDEQVKLGQLTREEAERSPLRNVITRAVGSQRSVSAEISEFESAPGDIFLLCSDGLTRELTDTRIQGLLEESSELDRICQQLIVSANDAGGRDNVTCIVVRAA
jgi:serine/threonine protein phosphatase PrpC